MLREQNIQRAAEGWGTSSWNFCCTRLALVLASWSRCAQARLASASLALASSSRFCSSPRSVAACLAMDSRRSPNSTATSSAACLPLETAPASDLCSASAVSAAVSCVLSTASWSLRSWSCEVAEQAQRESDGKWTRPLLWPLLRQHLASQSMRTCFFRACISF